MEKGSQLRNESRELKMKLSFKQAVNGILTACSKQDFSKAFERFTKSEQEALHRVFVQVISSMHANTLEQFESLCLETQVSDAFETVETVLEEQSLDPLFSDKTNVGDVWQDMASLKKKEIQHLENVLQTVNSSSITFLYDLIFDCLCKCIETIQNYLSSNGRRVSDNFMLCNSSKDLGLKIGSHKISRATCA